MTRISLCTRILTLFAFTLLAAGLAAAQTPVGANRPATVPADFVVTPFGYFHPSCVHHLAKGDVLLQDEGAVQHADRTYENFEECPYPHFDADGTKFVGNALPGRDGTVEPPTIGHSWIVDAETTISTSYGRLEATWGVPAGPTNLDGQTIYFFPGLEQAVGEKTILQPVLGWNADFANAWGIASWNCCVNGGANEATPSPVNSGDVIYGTIYYTCAKGTLSCGSWDIVTDDGSGGSSDMTGTSSHGQTFNWAFGGALEVWNVSRCGDYPAGGELSFYDVKLWDYKLIRVAAPAWTIVKRASGLTPQCSYGGSLPKQVDLTY